MIDVTALTRPQEASGMRLMLHFIYLQGMDVLTTLAFLLSGAQEANPLVKMALRLTDTPLGGLLLVKVGAIVLGGLCVWRGKVRLLAFANVFYALLVAWNLVSLILTLTLRRQGL
jgi:hypothetical protein